MRAVLCVRVSAALQLPCTLRWRRCLPSAVCLYKHKQPACIWLPFCVLHMVKPALLLVDRQLSMYPLTERPRGNEKTMLWFCSLKVQYCSDFSAWGLAACRPSAAWRRDKQDQSCRAQYHHMVNLMPLASGRLSGARTPVLSQGE